MFALRVMNIAQEMHLRGRADCQVKSDVKVANEEKKNVTHYWFMMLPTEPSVV